MRKRFIITLDIGDLPFELYGKNYNEIKDLLEVVYDGVCLDKTAMKKFSDIVGKQAKEYHTPNNKKPWRVVRMFDELGNQIAQES